MLSVRGLGMDYGDRTAVRALDLEVTRGECFGVLGPDGAGKTTTLSMICGVLTPTRGTVSIAGVDVHSDLYVAKAQLGFAPHEPSLNDELTASQHLRYFGAVYGLGGLLLVERVRSVLDAVGLSSRANDRVGGYSSAMKRLLGVAAAIIHQPRLVVLDEPATDTDERSRAVVFDLVRLLARAGTTVLYASRAFEEIAAVCNRFAVMEHGDIVSIRTVHELQAVSV